MKFKQLKDADWDVIIFSRTGPGHSYAFQLIKLLPREDGQPHDYAQHPHGCGQKYTVLQNNGIEGMERWEATMGDPIWIMLYVYVRGGMQGTLMKKCSATDKMAESIVVNAKKMSEQYKALIAELQKQNISVVTI